MNTRFFASISRLFDLRQTMRELDVTAEFDPVKLGPVNVQLYQLGDGPNGMG